MVSNIFQKVKVVYQDEYLLVVDKPAGVVTTREKKSRGVDENIYLEDWLKENYPNRLPRCGLVHRLDKGTSGLVVVARDWSSLSNLKNQFCKRQVQKQYLTLVEGRVPIKGDLKMPIGRSVFQLGRFKVKEDGRMAITEFELVKHLLIDKKDFSYLRIYLKTGRTHQIRVHLSYLGWPIVGDKVYGGRSLAGVNRPFLHATLIGLMHPKLDQKMVFELKLPTELEQILALDE